MIKHIGTSAIMDLLLRMLTCIEPQQLRQDVLNVRRLIIFIYTSVYIYSYTRVEWSSAVTLINYTIQEVLYLAGAQFCTVGLFVCVCVCDLSGWTRRRWSSGWWTWYSPLRMRMWVRFDLLLMWFLCMLWYFEISTVYKFVYWSCNCDLKKKNFIKI